MEAGLKPRSLRTIIEKGFLSLLPYARGIDQGMKVTGFQEEEFNIEGMGNIPP